MSTNSASVAPPPSGNLNRQGIVVAGMTTLSRISGFVRDIVVSYFLGASAMADAFYVAFRIPNFFRRLSAEGAFSQAFVPVLSSIRATGDRAALLRFVSVMSGHFSSVMFAVTLLGVVGAPLLVMLFAPGFWHNEAKLALTTSMLRVTFPYLGFISLTSFAAALLNSHQRYAVPAFTPVLLNVCLIAAALMPVAIFGERVIALAWGVFVAGLVQLLFQLPSLQRLHLLVMPRLDRKHEGVRRVGRLIVPSVFAASVSQINSLVDTMIASTLATGSISWLYYADRLLELPIGIVAVAISTVLLPNLSRLHARGADDGFHRTLDWGVKMSLLFSLPAALALYVLAVPLVASIFLRGALNAADVAMTALAVKMFAVGLVALTLSKVAAPAYFAREDTRSPFRIALVSVGTNLVLNLALFKLMGHVGLAFATSCAGIVQAYLLFRGVLARGHYRPGDGLVRFSVRVVAAVTLMVVVLAALCPADSSWLTMHDRERALTLLGICAAGAAAYFTALFAVGLRARELRYHV